MRSFTCSLFIAVVSLMLAGRVPLALAAPPLNDTFAGATLVDLGHSEVLDTTEATTDSDDAQLNAQCGAPATDASVWYAFTAAADGGVVVDVSQSSYSAGVLVGVGTQGNLQTVACGPDTVGFFAAAGTTYYLLAIDDQADGGGNGGNLSISIHEIPPPPTIDVALNRFGTVNPGTGVATISGTYTCTNADYVDVGVDARQNVGRFSIFGSGYFFDFGTCDGTSRSWSAAVVPYNGKFAGGKALSVAFAYACGQFQCSSGYAERTVMLRGGGS